MSQVALTPGRGQLEHAGVIKPSTAMRLDDASVQAFADIWKLQFGEELTLEQARTEAQRLLDFYAALAEPLPAEESQEDVTNEPP